MTKRQVPGEARIAKRWTQIGGDVGAWQATGRFPQYSVVLVRVGGMSDPRAIVPKVWVVHIAPIPVDDERGPGYFVEKAMFFFSDLVWSDEFGRVGIDRGEWESLSFEERAASLVERWLRSDPLPAHAEEQIGGQARTVEKWSDALPTRSSNIVWWKR